MEPKLEMGGSPTTSLSKYHTSLLKRNVDPNILLPKMGLDRISVLALETWRPLQVIKTQNTHEKNEETVTKRDNWEEPSKSFMHTHSFSVFGN